MSSILDTAMQFFDACETGKGWETCSKFCHPEATFSSQTTALQDISTLEGYCGWTKNLLVPIPDGRYELKCFAYDEARNSVAAVSVFHGTQTGPGGPVPPTGKTVAADYVYHIVFDGDRISHMTKMWNDTASLQQLGWA
jgi:predicted ester cyclase